MDRAQRLGEHGSAPPSQSSLKSTRAGRGGSGTIGLCAALERPDLAADPRFATNPGRVAARAELSARLAAIFATGPAAHWLALFDGAGVPCAPVQSVGEALADPVLRARAGLWEMAGPTFGRVETVASPLRLNRTPARLARPAPGLGEHTEEVERDGWG